LPPSPNFSGAVAPAVRGVKTGGIETGRPKGVNG
jgi:hypothetical protein